MGSVVVCLGSCGIVWIDGSKDGSPTWSIGEKGTGVNGG